jgi:hypothetical protein
VVNPLKQTLFKRRCRKIPSGRASVCICFIYDMANMVIICYFQALVFPNSLASTGRNSVHKNLLNCACAVDIAVSGWNVAFLKWLTASKIPPICVSSILVRHANRLENSQCTTMQPDHTFDLGLNLRYNRY